MSRHAVGQGPRERPVGEEGRQAHEPGVAPLFVERPYDPQGRLQLREVVDLLQERSEEGTRHRSEAHPWGKARESAHLGELH